MTTNGAARRRAFLTLISVALAGSVARASKSIPPQLYEVTTETGMPHLEENLRYSNTREKRCLTRQRLSDAFPFLNHASLRGCKLEQESRQDDVVTYLLVCDGGHGTTGSATWQLGAHRIQGTLHVKLGGKNMTCCTSQCSRMRNGRRASRHLRNTSRTTGRDTPR